MKKITYLMSPLPNVYIHIPCTRITVTYPHHTPEPASALASAVPHHTSASAPHAHTRTTHPHSHCTHKWLHLSTARRIPWLREHPVTHLAKLIWLNMYICIKIKKYMHIPYRHSILKLPRPLTFTTNPKCAFHATAPTPNPIVHCIP